MKPIRTYRKKFRKTVLRTSSVLIAALALASSCLPETIDDQPTYTVDTERIDLAITGAMDHAIHNEGENGLVFYNPSSLPLFNENEHIIRLVIDETSSLEPWTPGWEEWCTNRYRSFNINTGTYRGYDGLDHFCVPK